MRVETRGPGGIYGRRRLFLMICENDEDNQIFDGIGKPGDRFTAELALADGYGEAYVRFEKKKPCKNKRSKPA